MKTKKLLNPYLLVIITSIISQSCDTSSNTKAISKESLLTKSDSVAIDTDYSINKLNYLYTDSAAFNKWWRKHPTKIMFRFTFSKNQITLIGWAPNKGNDNSDDYDITDTLKLSVSDMQNPLVGDEMYFGNIKLCKDCMKKIAAAIKDSAAQFIYFKPVNYSLDNKNIAYEIYVPSQPWSYDSSIVVNKTSGKLIVNADPSPPASRK